MAKFDYRSNDSADLKKKLGLDGKFVLIYPGKIGTFYLVDEMLDFYRAMAKAVPNAVFLVLTNDDTSALLKKASYKGACATNRGFDILNKWNMYELNRISVRNSNPYFSLSNLWRPFRFRAKLSGYYNLFRRKKRGD